MVDTKTSCLREHNIETFNNILNILKDSDRCAVVQPTGTGKSYIMMELMKVFDDKWKIIIAPSRNFLDKLSQNKYWIEHKTLTLTYSHIGLNCDNIENLLADFGINKEFVGLIILDEMHRAAAPKWGAGVKNLINLCNKAKTVGLTATPKRYDKDIDMVEYLFDNKLASNMTLYDAINMNILPKLNYVVGIHDISVNINEIENKIPKDKEHEYIIEQLEDYKQKWDFVNYFTSTISKYIDTSDKTGKHLVFVSSIEEADRMQNVIKSWFSKLYSGCTVNVYCIHSKISNSGERLLEFFRDNEINEVKVAVAVNMLNESFHCNDIKTISTFRGTQSVQVYMQQIGRALASDGGSPYIFDFVDNFNSIDEIKDVITGNKSDGKTVIFSKFIDEAYWFGRDLVKLKNLCNEKRVENYLDICNKLKNSTDGTIYTIPNIKFVRWADYLLSKYTINLLGIVSDDLRAKIGNELNLSLNINRTLGIDWYITWLKVLNEDEVEDKRQLKKLRSKFNQKILLNNLDKETIEFFKSHGLETTITSNLEKLDYLLENNKPKNKRISEYLENFRQYILDDFNFLAFKEYRKIDKLFGHDGTKHFTPDMIGDACAYWIWMIYNNTYKYKIESLCKYYEKHRDIEVLLTRGSKTYECLDVYHVNLADKYFKNYKDIEELEPGMKSMLEGYKVKNLDRIHQLCLRELSLTEIISYIENRIENSIKINSIDNKLVDYCYNQQRIIEDKLDFKTYTWSDIIIERYDYLKKLCETLDKYVNNKIDVDDTWFIDYVQTVKYNLMLRKNIKSKIITSGSITYKFITMLDKYNTMDSIINNIDKKWEDNFKLEYINAEKNLKNTIEHKAFIGFIALAKCGICNKEVNKNQITDKFYKCIFSLFAWAKYCDLYILRQDEKITSIAKEYNETIKYLGNDVVKLFNSAMSKNIKYSYMCMYDRYIENKGIAKRNVIATIDGCIDTDIQLICNVSNSKVINDYSNLDKFNLELIEIYNNNKIK